MNSKTPAHVTRVLDPFSWSSDFDSLAAQQFREQWQGIACLQSEKKLMFAVLVDAIECFQKYALLPGPHARRLFENAQDWIFQNNREWPFSFINVCEAMEIDPSYLRKGLSEWKQRSVRQPVTQSPCPKLKRALHQSPATMLRSLL